jgi:hypothetical protein
MALVFMESKRVVFKAESQNEEIEEELRSERKFSTVVSKKTVSAYSFICFAGAVFAMNGHL